MGVETIDGSKDALEEASPRVGVFICHCGGNISDVVDVDKVVEAAGRLPHVAVAKKNMFMCSDPGQAMIIEAITRDRLDRVVVAACSPSLHELTFRQSLARAGLSPYMYEHVNIREQVSWVSKSNPQGATDKAIRLVAAGVAKARRLQPLQPVRVEARRRVAVIGGGVAGLRCARDLSRCQLDVDLIEKAQVLGGNVLELHRLYPTEQTPVDLLEPLLDEVRNDPRITVHTSSEAVSVAGSVGNFRLQVRTAAANGSTGSETSRAEDDQVIAGAIVIATGFEPYEPHRGEYGYGNYPEVITLPQFARLLDSQDADGDELTHNGRSVRHMAFIHCVGSRQRDGLHQPGPNGNVNEYCSRYCCTATLQAANEICQRFPGVNVFDFYQDIRTYGRGHEEYYENASKHGVLFLRYVAEESPVVTRPVQQNGSPLVVKVKDTLTFGEELEVPVDLVVLSTGMVARRIDKLVEELKLPRGSDGFLQEVHPKLRPVESAVKGVLLAGTCQAPMDITESCASGGAAAAKAATILARDYIELDPFVAEVDPDLCEGEGLCIRECKYQEAISLVERETAHGKVKQAQVNAALCVGCGMCVAVCPHHAIQLAGWRLDQFDAMVDAIAADTLG